jgi:hypothetical protein
VHGSRSARSMISWWPRSRPRCCIRCPCVSADARWPRSNQGRHRHERASQLRAARPGQRHRLGGGRSIGDHDCAAGRAAPRRRGDRAAPGRGGRRPGGARGGRCRRRRRPGGMWSRSRGRRGDGRPSHLVPAGGLGRAGGGPRAYHGRVARRRRCRRQSAGRTGHLRRPVPLRTTDCRRSATERTSGDPPRLRSARSPTTRAHDERSFDADGRTDLRGCPPPSEARSPSDDSAHHGNARRDTPTDRRRSLATARAGAPTGCGSGRGSPAGAARRSPDCGGVGASEPTPIPVPGPTAP